MVDAINNTNQALLQNTVVEKIQQAQQGSPGVQHHLFSKQLNEQEELKRNKISDTHQIDRKSVNEKKKEEKGDLKGKKKKFDQQLSEEESKSDPVQILKTAEDDDSESQRHIDIRV